MTAIVIDLTKE